MPTTLFGLEAVRPELSLMSILGYAFFAFLIGLLLTPWFINFLRLNKLGKQLRVETVDGREASIFRQYHQKKFGTPTMGGILIWGSILFTVLFSRLLSLMGIVESSLLQRGEVYIPLISLVMFGILGAIDDYINIVGSDEKKIREIVPALRVFFAGSILLAGIGVALILSPADTPIGLSSPYALFYQNIVQIAGIGGFVAFLVVFIVPALILLFARQKTNEVLQNFLVKQGAKKGLAVIPKITSLLLISLIGALWFSFKLERDAIDIPFYGLLMLNQVPVPGVGIMDLSWLYVLIFIFVVIGTANAVNVTDGLDGLAGGLLVIAFGSFALLAYVQGLYILSAFCAVTVGAIAAFLWHNVPPALFYMGDTGALALGGTLGIIALMTDQVLILPLVGFVFVMEMLSVIIQLTSKKLRGGKKIFKAAPIHHHFEALEWGKSKVTMRMWIIGAFFAFIGIIVAVIG
jgi:phospho-N-acetylmuramoyl-pentapeptide-transferase